MSKKILIITPSWIGDCVMTQPLYRRLHELHPGCTIDAFAPKWSMAVFERMPEINRVMENPFGHGALELKKRWRIGRELGKEGYDQVIVLPGSLKSAIIALATGIKQRTGYVGESRYFLLNDIRKLDKAALPLMVDRYTALAHPTQADFNGHSDNPCFTIDPESRQAAL
ncbi:MAG: lipopolysaccharide heptosyltransferase II, partial [Neisseria subflava]|nr:lipopolysaccharide heptosyltransferase II [Neisseria subflava]